MCDTRKRNGDFHVDQSDKVGGEEMSGVIRRSNNDCGENNNRPSRRVKGKTDFVHTVFRELSCYSGGKGSFIRSSTSIHSLLINNSKM